MSLLHSRAMGSTAFKPCRGTLKPAFSRAALVVEANKRVQKRQKVILVKEVPGVGREGELMTVPLGYWRNYLAPQRLAKIASEGILEGIKKQKQEVLRAKLEEKAQAQAFANALATIGKFMLKKRAGDKDSLFSAVTKKEVSDAIYQQTGRSIEEFEVSMPDMKTLGTYECSVKLHPEVNGIFSIVIQREKQAPAAKKK